LSEGGYFTINDFVGSLDVAAGEPLLLPQRFRQNRAWIELKKIWRMKKKVKGFIIKKIKGGYSVAIAGFIISVDSMVDLWLLPKLVRSGGLDLAVCE
jgi:ribosomal protein S1